MAPSLFELPLLQIIGDLQIISPEIMYNIYKIMFLLIIALRVTLRVWLTPLSSGSLGSDKLMYDLFVRIVLFFLTLLDIRALFEFRS